MSEDRLPSDLALVSVDTSFAALICIKECKTAENKEKCRLVIYPISISILVSFKSVLDINQSTPRSFAIANRGMKIDAFTRYFRGARSADVFRHGR
jgi:hypothetical protein